MFHHVTKTFECLQRAKQGDAQASRGLFVPRRGQLHQLSARTSARLLPEIIELFVVTRKAMLDAAIVRQQPLFDYRRIRLLPAERLIELHRRNLRSQRLKFNPEQTRIEQSSQESPPHHQIKKESKIWIHLIRIASEIQQLTRMCNHSLAVKFGLFLLAPKRAGSVTAKNNRSRSEKNASGLAKKRCLEFGTLFFFADSLTRQRQTGRFLSAEKELVSGVNKINPR